MPGIIDSNNLEVISMSFIKQISIYVFPLFFTWFCHAGIVTAVTRADIKGKAVVLFHDRHQGYIDIQGERYDVPKLAESQKKPLFTYFDKLFKELDGKLPFLLECRSVLKDQLQQLQKGQSYAAMQGFFEQFYNAYAKPQEHEKLNTLCDIDNFDERDAHDNRVGNLHMRFGPLAKRIIPGSLPMGILNHPDQIAQLDAKKARIAMSSIVQDAQYRNEKQDTLDRYGYTQAQEWFEGIKQRIVEHLDKLRPVIGQTAYFAQKEDLLATQLKQLGYIVNQYTKDNEDILAGMYAYLENSGSFAQLQGHLNAIFQIICTIVDLHLLSEALTTQEGLMFIHVGGMHARQLETDFHNLGIDYDKWPIFNSKKDVADPMRLYNKLQEIAPVDKLAQKMCRAQQTQTESPKTDCSGELSKKDMPVQEGFIATIVVFLKKLFGLVFAQ